MKIENRSLLTTGANRGIGRALLDEALRRGVKKVYAGASLSWEVRHCVCLGHSVSRPTLGPLL
jgi:NAD(P)-dependent dehydrogenase (short-subunit alcohol dehydrogenase family)